MILALGLCPSITDNLNAKHSRLRRSPAQRVLRHCSILDDFVAPIGRLSSKSKQNLFCSRSVGFGYNAAHANIRNQIEPPQRIAAARKPPFAGRLSPYPTIAPRRAP